mmetsp:Transcript_55068/g.87347  ORF Transcript_55068/g.87347 Transcript_55068/m.87347 type:complete len:108 (+) Transcript_55068:523-846(+)
MSTASRNGNLDAKSPTGPRALTGDSPCIPYCPHIGDDGIAEGIGEKASDASSDTDFVGVGGIMLKLPSESTNSSAKGSGLLRERVDSPPVFVLIVEDFDIGVAQVGP